MGEKNAAFFGSPLQENRIAHAGQAGFLCTHDVKVRLPSQETPHNIIVEAFVRGEGQHSCR